jgi:hypothetical protein
VPKITEHHDRDIEMTEFSEQDLIMIQRWQRMHGNNQRKQGGITPPKDGSAKASPQNKKKKSSGTLFPSPKDTRTNAYVDRDAASTKGDGEAARNSTEDSDTKMVNELGIAAGGDHEEQNSPTGRTQALDSPTKVTTSSRS